MVIKRPDPSTHVPTPKRANELVSHIGKSAAWISRNTGIPYNRLRMILAGHKEAGGKRIAVTMRYPEQYALEMLAAFLDQGRID